MVCRSRAAARRQGTAQCAAFEVVVVDKVKLVSCKVETSEEQVVVGKVVVVVDKVGTSEEVDQSSARCS